MSQGFNHVNRAVQILVGRNAMLNQRLYEAAREFSAAMEDAEQWPKNLREKASRIDKQLTKKGRIAATINGMDVRDAERIAMEILEISREIGSTRVHMHRSMAAVPAQ